MKSTETEARQRELILSNELVAGNEEIADIIFSEAKLVTHNRGHLLIKEGDEEDIVYFILKGSVSVQNEVRHLADKQVPETVGEMAAKRVGSKRSADVRISSDTAQFLALSGLKFRQLMDDYPTFKNNLELAIDTMNREKIAQLGETNPKGQLPWVIISALVSLVVVGVVGAVMLNEGYSWKTTAMAAVGFGTISFVMILLLNPALIYRNMFRLSSFMLISLIAYGNSALLHLLYLRTTLIHIYLI